MREPQTLDRREFARGSAMALLSGIAVTVTGCGGGGGSSYPTAATPPAAGTPEPEPESESGTDDGAVRAAISNNHGHEAVITAAQFASPTDLVLDIRGQADHNHRVEISVAELDLIQQGSEVSKPCTDTQGHHHQVTFGSTTETPDPY